MKNIPYWYERSIWNNSKLWFVNQKKIQANEKDHGEIATAAPVCGKRGKTLLKKKKSYTILPRKEEYVIEWEANIRNDNEFSHGLNL